MFREFSLVRPNGIAQKAHIFSLHKYNKIHKTETLVQTQCILSVDLLKMCKILLSGYWIQIKKFQ